MEIVVETENSLEEKKEKEDSLGDPLVIGDEAGLSFYFRMLRKVKIRGFNHRPTRYNCTANTSQKNR